MLAYKHIISIIKYIYLTMHNSKKPTTAPGQSLKNIINDTKTPLSKYIHKRIAANDKNMTYIEKLKSMLTSNTKYEYQHNLNNVNGKNRFHQKYSYTYTQTHTIHHDTHMQNQKSVEKQKNQKQQQLSLQKRNLSNIKNEIIHKRAESLMVSQNKKLTPRIRNNNTNKSNRFHIDTTPAKNSTNEAVNLNTSTFINDSIAKNNMNLNLGNAKNSIIKETPISSHVKPTHITNRLRISQRRVTDHELINQIKTDLIRKRVISNNSTNLHANSFIDQKNFSGNLNSYLNNFHNISVNVNMNANNNLTNNSRSKYQVINYNKFTPLPKIGIPEPKEIQNICSKWGKMELFTVLGSGANANVREGLCNGSRYAVKIYQKYKLIQPRKKKRVYTQIQLLKFLPQHSNIITMHQAFQDKREIHVIFQHVDSSITLNQYFRNNVLYIEQQNIQKIFGRIVRGVYHLHENGIAHRDLKPDNILITTDEDGQIVVKIIDFGFATNTTSADLQCGTPNFMAPQLLDKCIKYNPLCVDIWALGVIIFYLFEGRYPFKGYDQKDLYRSIKSGHFQFKKIVQPYIIDIIQSILVVNPLERATAKQLLQKQWILNI